jgi:exo-beta-1,3-glucanase (GH17 family)
MIVAIGGVIQLTKAQESWLLYRSAAETLIREYNLYMLKAGDYPEPSSTDDKRDKLFVERVESIMSTEGTKYLSLRQQKSESASTKG